MKPWKFYLMGAFLFLLGWEWSAYIVHKDVSQFGTQLQCTQQGDLQK